MNPYDTSSDVTDFYIHAFAAMAGQRAFRRHRSHVWEFDKGPKRRAGFTKNKRRGTSKAMRRMQAKSRKTNRV